MTAHAQAEATATELLRNAGQRVTKPRVLVLTKIVEAGEHHVSADEVLTEVAIHDATVHRATVYRTLEGLTEVGVLDHVHLDRGLTAYHLSDAVRGQHDPHLHAQCSNCGAVVDLPGDALGDAAKRIKASTGFELDASHVALSGHCKACAHRA